MNAITPAPLYIMPYDLRKQIRRVGPLAAIILLHVAFFYALQSGAIVQTKQAIPKEVFATLITPQAELAPAPPPPKEQAKPTPKTAPIIKKAVAPPLPVVHQTPSPIAVTAPLAPPEPAAPVAAAPEPAPVPAPVAPPAPAAPRTISSGVEYIQKPQPEYPAASKRMGEEGQVVLRVLINEQGRADSIELQKTSGSARLDEAGRQAVQRARFKPQTENGKPVKVYAIVPIRFQLDN
ncbi:MAG: tonB family C-terminal domain protein [Herbaspirillum sp.]|jgi:protein TonB|nr:tonB family C-terminal domain protein [Herbaspirillum sp.]